MLLDPYERLTLNPFHNKPMKTSERIFSSMLRTKQESTLPVVRTFTFCAHHSTTLARIPLNNPLSACHMMAALPASLTKEQCCRIHRFSR